MSYLPFVRLCRGFVTKGVVNTIIVRNMSMEQERKHRVLVTRRVPKAGIEILKASQRCDIDLWDSDDPISREELLRRVCGLDGLYCLLTEKVDAELLEAAGEGIVVGHTPGVLTDATRDCGGWGTWKPLWMCGPTLMGSTVGIVGFGRIGIAVAQRLAPFGVARFLYSDVNKKSENEERIVTPKAEHVDMDTLFKEADFVTAHTALTPQTAGMFNKDAFHKMKRSAVFVNTSSFDANYKSGAGLDVTVPEPLPLDHPLLTLKNCVVLPHIGSAEESTRELMSILAAKNLLAGLAGESLPAQAKL
ncbi:Glyoxylate reductase/hydroxypyruvate reductase [Acropora cervicornis]|uniref:Glyoxylate reductase/hydroxypyruvate reductase n=1 Tax=Acropora cervicornis TaxID=6130 RepID=A0AAD9QRR3_ACRCE|nr:Glyoxylate reductase/hydroxypyruvate reductase [Acropora cervicornis]